MQWRFTGQQTAAICSNASVPLELGLVLSRYGRTIQREMPAKRNLLFGAATNFLANQRSDSKGSLRVESSSCCCLSSGRRTRETRFFRTPLYSEEPTIMAHDSCTTLATLSAFRTNEKFYQVACTFTTLFFCFDLIPASTLDKFVD